MWRRYKQLPQHTIASLLLHYLHTEPFFFFSQTKQTFQNSNPLTQTRLEDTVEPGKRELIHHIQLGQILNTEVEYTRPGGDRRVLLPGHIQALLGLFVPLQPHRNVRASLLAPLEHIDQILVV